MIFARRIRANRGAYNRGDFHEAAGVMQDSADFSARPAATVTNIGSEQRQEDERLIKLAV